MPQPPLDIRRFLNVRACSTPSISSDGSRVTFLTNITGVPQVWSVPLAGGWPEQLTFHDDRVAFARCSPAADQLVYGIDRGGDERVQLHLLNLDGTGDRALTAAPAVIHTFGDWSPDGRQIAYSANARDPRFSDIYLLDIESGAARVVFEADGTYRALSFSPDGRSLVISRIMTGFINELLLLDLETGSERNLTGDAEPARYHAVAWQPDGGACYCISDRSRDLPALCRLDPANGALQVLFAPAGEVEDAVLSPDGRLLAYTVNVDGYSQLGVLDTATGNHRSASDLPRGVVADPMGPALSWGPDSHTLAFVFSSGARPADIWLWDIQRPDERAVRLLTQSSRGGLPSGALVEPELVRWAAHDGLSIPGFWYAPADTPGPLPVVLYVHGGPEGQTRPTASGSNVVISYLVARGYCVLAPNVRGSTGYGNRYRSLDDVELRMDSVADLKSAVAWLVESGRADRERIAIMGGSYGGFMVLSALTTYPELWAAGVNLFGIANWVTFLERTGPWRRKLREAEYGSLEQNRAFLERISPINHVDQIRAPLLVLQGANDPRVPPDESEQIVAAVRGRGLPCEYVLFPDEGHGFVKLANRIVCYSTAAAFLDAVLAPRAAAGMRE